MPYRVGDFDELVQVPWVYGETQRLQHLFYVRLILFRGFFVLAIVSPPSSPPLLHVRGVSVVAAGPSGRRRRAHF